MASALHGEGMGALWEVVGQFVEAMKEAGEFGEKRKQQRRLWMWNHIDWKLIHRYMCMHAHCSNGTFNFFLLHAFRPLQKKMASTKDRMMSFIRRSLMHTMPRISGGKIITWGGVAI